MTLTRHDLGCHARLTVTLKQHRPRDYDSLVSQNYDLHVVMTHDLDPA